MSKILCCIGIHSWSNYGKVIKGLTEDYQVRYCKKCGKADKSIFSRDLKYGFTESVNESIENLKAEIK